MIASLRVTHRRARASNCPTVAISQHGPDENVPFDPRWVKPVRGVGLSVGARAFSAGSIDSHRSTCNAQAMEHRELIESTIALSKKGVQLADGGPFGALVARAGEVIAEGWNRVLSSHDPTAHAEIVVIRAATKALGSFSLSGCVLYSSCEPCPMCLAATYWARIDHVYYANTRADAAAIGFDDQFFYDELMRPASDRSLPTTRLEVAGAVLPMSEWRQDPNKTCY